jgi:hypothetical protein
MAWDLHLRDHASEHATGGDDELSGVFHMVRATADETVNNSNTLQDDDELLFPMLADEVWFFEAFLIFVAPGTSSGDMHLRFTIPAGATITWGNIGTTNHFGYGSHVTTNTPLGMRSGASTLEFGTFNGTSGNVVGGVVVCGATPGDARLQWAQQTAVSADLTRKANSFVRALRLA